MNKLPFILGVFPSKSDKSTNTGDTPILINRGFLIRAQHHFLRSHMQVLHFLVHSIQQVILEGSSLAGLTLRPCPGRACRLPTQLVFPIEPRTAFAPPNPPPFTRSLTRLHEQKQIIAQMSPMLQGAQCCQSSAGSFLRRFFGLQMLWMDHTLQLSGSPPGIHRGSSITCYACSMFTSFGPQSITIKHMMFGGGNPED